MWLFHILTRNIKALPSTHLYMSSGTFSTDAADVVHVYMEKTDLCWAVCIIETSVCVHDARCWLMSVWSGSQCQELPFFFFYPAPLFVTLSGSAVSVLCQSTPVQLKISSRLSSQALSLSKHASSCHVSQSFTCSVLSLIALLVTTCSYEGWSETDSQPLYSACMLFFCFFCRPYTTTDQSSLR